MKRINYTIHYFLGSTYDIIPDTFKDMSQEDMMRDALQLLSVHGGTVEITEGTEDNSYIVSIWGAL